MQKKIVILFALFIFSINQNIFCNNLNRKSNENGLKKFPGFIGVYHNFKGTVYGGWGIPKDELLQRAFNFGENSLICQADYAGYTFEACLDSSVNNWDINKIFGILRPPSEYGSVNQPGDTLLLKPYASLPGMIQAAHRFSELSKIYPQISGAIIDDFFGKGDYPANITLEDVIKIKDALIGRKLDSNGNVEHNSIATTPNLKLYIVLYADHENEIDVHDNVIKKVIDGINLWIRNQASNYSKLDLYLEKAHKNFPNKNIVLGIFTNTENDGKAIGHKSIFYLIKHAIDYYNKGSISGIQLFSGPWLSEDYISKARWDSLAIPEILNKYYYPYLGEAYGKIINAVTGKPISNAIVTIKRANVNIPIIISRKTTNDSGEYDFGAWAGESKKITYKITIEKTSYKPQIIEIILKQQERVLLPEIRLQKYKS